MSGKDKRSLCWGAALFITAGSAVYLGIHWGGAVGEPPYGVAQLLAVLLLVLVYAGHQAAVDRPKLVYVREDAAPHRTAPHVPAQTDARYLTDMAESVRLGREMERRRIEPPEVEV